ncbi:MAG: hypothetical protein V1880_00820, partial [Patescibacteria group bacterium]
MSAGTAVSPATEQEIKEKYYTNTLGLSEADTPYIVKAVSKTDGTYALYVAFNGFESDGTLKIDGFEVFGSSQTSGIRALKEGTVPLQTVTGVTYNSADKAYLFDIDYKTQLNNPLYNNDKKEMESIILRAFRDVNGKQTYSRLSWPLIGLTPDKNQITTYEFDNSQVYQEFFGVAKVKKPSTAPSITVLPAGLKLGTTASLAADKPCDWTLKNGGGKLTGTVNNVA